MVFSLEEESDLPWDPLWEYFLGDDEDTIESDRGGFAWNLRRPRADDDDESFMVDFMGSYDNESERKTQRNGRRETKENTSRSFLGASSSSLSTGLGTSTSYDKTQGSHNNKSNRKLFWRRGGESLQVEGHGSWSLGFDPDIFGQAEPDVKVERSSVADATSIPALQNESREDVGTTSKSKMFSKSTGNRSVDDTKGNRKPFWRRRKSDSNVSVSKQSQSLNKTKRRSLFLFSRPRQSKQREPRDEPLETRIDVVERRGSSRGQSAEERDTGSLEWGINIFGDDQDDNQKSNKEATHRRKTLSHHQEDNRQSSKVATGRSSRAQSKTGTRTVPGSMSESQSSSVFDWSRFDTSTSSEEPSSKEDKPGATKSRRKFFVRQNGSVSEPSADSSISSKLGLAGLFSWAQDSQTDGSSSQISSDSIDESSGESPENDDGWTEYVDNKTPRSTQQKVSEVRLRHQPRRSVESLPPFQLPAIKEERSGDSIEVNQIVQVEEKAKEALRVLDLEDPAGHMNRANQDDSARVEEAASRNRRKRVTKGQKTVVRHLGCRSVKDLTVEQQQQCEATGLPVHELSFQELSGLFPKVRSVSDEHKAVSSSSILGSSRAFKNSCPAHLQASPEYFGPQSLYEYEYETGIHMYVSYAFHGNNGKSLLNVVNAQTPLPEKQFQEQVLIQVEASTVSPTDCCIRRGEWRRGNEITLPMIPGVDVVGKIFSIDSDSSKRYGLSQGDRVISLVKWGGNARYASVDPSSLVKVPEAIDPAVAVCLAETYLTAFQALHYLQSDEKRYLATALQGQSVLLLGTSVSNMGRAIAQLAFDAGADNVYAINSLDRHRELAEMEISPLDADSFEWWESLVGNIDCILSLQETIDPSLYNLLKSSGKVIIVNRAKSREEAKHPTPIVDHSAKYSKRRQKSTTYVYDIYEEWETEKDLCKLDLVHLVELLQHNLVAPSVFDRVPLSKVGSVQGLVESEEMLGFVVCEPWQVAKSRAIRL